MRLWIDDERPMPSDFTHRVKNSADALAILEASRANGDTPELISFDHDLSITDGNDDTSRRVMLWIIENDFWPAEMRFHTANPYGHEWLVGMAVRYAPESCVVDPTDPWVSRARWR
jgi:hypothetical protein